MLRNASESKAPLCKRQNKTPELLHISIAAAALIAHDLSLPMIQEMEQWVPETDEAVRPTWAAVAALHRMDWLFRNNRFAEEEELARRTLAGGLLDGLTAYRGLMELRLGIACWYLRNNEEAMAAFQRVAANEAVAAPERGQAETRIAELLHDEGRSQEARAHLARAKAVLGEPVEQLDERLFLAAVEDRIAGVALEDLRSAFDAFVQSQSEPLVPRAGGVGFLASLRRREFLMQLLGSEMDATAGEAGILAALEDLYRAQACSTLVLTAPGLPRDRIGAVVPRQPARR